MALQVKRKNIGQTPTRNNPYLNKKNLPYQKGIIMEEGGELQPGQLSQSDIEKKLALQNKLAYQKSLPENQGKSYNWYERNIKNPLDGMGVNTDAIEFGVEGAGYITGAMTLGNLAKNNIKRLLSKKSKDILPKEKIITKVTNGDKEIFVDELGNEVGSIQRFSEIDNARNINWGSPKQVPPPKTIPNPDYTDKGNRWLNMRDKKKPGFDDMKPGVQKAIGGMFNPFKEKIVPQGISTESDDYSYEDDMDDIEDDYESQLSEKDIEMENKSKEYKLLQKKALEKDFLISQLEKSKSEMESEQAAQALLGVNMYNYNGNDIEDDNSFYPGAGQKGKEIIGDLTNVLGYTPQFNSIARTPEKQEQLIKQGFGVKNSFHLTGDAVDLKPEDWKKVPDMVKSKMKGKYDVVSHNNHVHIEPKTRFKVGGVYEGIDYKGLEELKKLGYKFEIL